MLQCACACAYLRRGAGSCGVRVTLPWPSRSTDMAEPEDVLLTVPLDLPEVVSVL